MPTSYRMIRLTTRPCTITADIAAGRQVGRRERSIREVEIRRARVLFEAERQLELAAHDLHGVELLVVHVDVAPGIVLLQLPLDLEPEEADDHALDADALARQIERPVFVIRERRVRRAIDEAEPRAERDPRVLAEDERGMVFPAKPGL